MTPEAFEAFYPVVMVWIQGTIKDHAKNGQTVASRGFLRLPHYFQAETLTSSNAVVVDRLPVPHLSSMGLVEFEEFERGNFNGITYLNTFFLKPAVAKDEAIYFHELIHVIQWRVLGAKEFLRTYADGLQRFGYRKNPLEIMAYDAEDAFRASIPFDAEKLVSDALAKMTTS